MHRLWGWARWQFYRAHNGVELGLRCSGTRSSLALEGLPACNHLGYGAVVVIGHQNYYPRFGFTPAARFNLRSEYDVPDDVFMALELTPNYLQGTSGAVYYHSAFTTCRLRGMRAAGCSHATARKMKKADRKVGLYAP